MKFPIFSLLLLLLLLPLLFSLSAATATATPNRFILASCRHTTYPRLCIASLSAYAPLVRRSPRLIARTALAISVKHATETSAYVAHLSSTTRLSSTTHAQASTPFKDCMNTMTDSAEMLRRSMRQLRYLGRVRSPSFSTRLSNVQTWLSAALTDQTVCLLNFMQEDVVDAAGTRSREHTATRKKVVQLTQITSNALALVNRLGSRN